MDEDIRTKFVDDLLEASLSRYGSVTPRPGLEARVLTHARAAAGRRAWFVWAGWLAAGAAAVVVAIGVLQYTHQQSISGPPKPAGAVTTAGAPDLGPFPAILPNERAHIVGRVFFRPLSGSASKRVIDEPHTGVFPSPQPETSEEKLMLQYVHKTPASELTAFPVESAEIPDLEIKKLDIPPLVSDADDTKNK